MQLKEKIHKEDPNAPREARCFFCYGRFEEEEIIVTDTIHRIFHLDCVKDMLVANEIENAQLERLHGHKENIQGIQWKYSKPF